jgi:DNA-binding MarR family transcriptional regulator
VRHASLVLVLERLDHYSRRGPAWASHSRIAEDVGFEPRWVRKLLRRAEEQGLVEVERARGATSRYQLTEDGAALLPRNKARRKPAEPRSDRGLNPGLKGPRSEPRSDPGLIGPIKGEEKPSAPAEPQAIDSALALWESPSLTQPSSTERLPERRGREGAREAAAVVYEELVAVVLGGARPTKQESKRVHAAAREIAAAGGEGQVSARAANYRRHREGAVLTPWGLASNWGLCAQPPPPKQNGSARSRTDDDVRRWLARAEEERQKEQARYGHLRVIEATGD